MSYTIREDLINNNRPKTALSPQGVVIHSTDTPGATAQNEHDYFGSDYRAASAHYFIDWYAILRCIPENEQAWHAGPTANSKYLSIEMCEPYGSDAAKFQEVWNRTVWLVAKLCVDYGWETGPNVWSHNGISGLYHETTHTDPYGYLQRFGKSWNALLAAIDAEIARLKQPSPSPDENSSTQPTPQPATPVLNFSYPNNALVVLDDLYIRDANGVRIPGRYVAIGDNISVLDVSYSKQLALVEYPTPSGVRSGYVRNVPQCIQYYYKGQWVNGSTPEPVLDEKGRVIGSLNPRERATPLYRKNGKLHVVYNTVKGVHTKSGYVKWDSGFSKF